MSRRRVGVALPLACADGKRNRSPDRSPFWRDGARTRDIGHGTASLDVP